MAVGAAPTQEDTCPSTSSTSTSSGCRTTRTRTGPRSARRRRRSCAEIQAAGELVYTHGLEEEVAFAHADYDGRRVGRAATGPFAETKEWIGGFALVDVADDERAKYWTQRIAVGCRWPQEVRKFKEPGGMRGL